MGSTGSSTDQRVSKLNKNEKRRDDCGRQGGPWGPAPTPPRGWGAAWGGLIGAQSPQGPRGAGGRGLLPPPSERSADSQAGAGKSPDNAESHVMPESRSVLKGRHGAHSQGLPLPNSRERPKVNTGSNRAQRGDRWTVSPYRREVQGGHLANFKAPAHKILIAKDERGLQSGYAGEGSP